MHPPPMPEASVALLGSWALYRRSTLSHYSPPGSLPSGAEPSRGIEPRAPGYRPGALPKHRGERRAWPRGSEAPSLCRRRAAADAARRGWPSTPRPSPSTPLLASLPRLAPAQDTSRATRANLPSATPQGGPALQPPTPADILAAVAATLAASAAVGLAVAWLAARAVRRRCQRVAAERERAASRRVEASRASVLRAVARVARVPARCGTWGRRGRR